MDLSEEELLGAPCVRLFKVGRLRLVRGEAPEAFSALFSAPEEADSPSPVEAPVEAPPVVAETPSEPEPAPEPEPTPEPLSDSAPIPQEDEAVSGPDLEDVSYVWTSDELYALNADDQKTICRSRSLKVGGREASRVQRILEAQGEES